ncbi:phage tail protein [Metabacillus fastidiosus]|uniref:phage tail protein n=1 Tax=Metabacillus fastidiosus TaxID=1458 RepID=UPI003D2B4274
MTAILEARDRISDTLRRINSHADGTRRILRDLNRSGINAFTGMSVNAGTTVSAISALIPASASASTAVMGIASSFAAAGTGVLAFGAVTTSVLGDLFESSEEVSKLEEKIASTGSLKEKIKAQQELASVYADMSKVQRGALKELQGFKSFWGDFTEQFEEPIFQAFGTGLEATRKILDKFTPTITNVSGVVNELMDGLNRSIDTSQATKFFDWLEENAARSFHSFALIAANTTSGIFSMFQAFAPIGASIEETLVSMTQRFKEWADGLQGSKAFSDFIEYAKSNGPPLLSLFSNIGNVIGDIVTGLAPMGSDVLKALAGITGFLSKITDVFRFIGDNWDTIKTAIIGIGTFIGVMYLLNGAVTAVKASVAAFNAVLLMSPTTWIIIGIAALIAIVVVLATKFQWVRDIFSATWNFLKTSFQAVMEWLKPYVTEAMAQVMSAFTAVKDYIAEIMPMLQQIFGTYWSIYSAIFKFYLTTIWTIVSFAFKTIWNVISLVLKTIGNTINLWWGIISGLFKVGLQILTGDWSGAWETLKKTASGAIENLGKLFKDWIDGAAKIGKDFIQGVIDGFLGMWDSLKNTAQSIWKSITGIFDQKQSIQVDVNRSFIDKYSPATLPTTPKVDGHAYFGENYVPRDGMLYRVHKGERILTADENKTYSSGRSNFKGGGNGGDINIYIDGVTVREESDINKIADALAAKLLEAKELGA